MWRGRPGPRLPAAEKNPSPTRPRQLTHNQAHEQNLRWANDSRHIFFTVEDGDVTGPYRDLQPHLYWVDSEKPDSETGAAEQWSKDFIGPIEHYAVAADNVLASARLGTEVPMYSAAKPDQSLHKLNTWEGTYENYPQQRTLPASPSSTPRCRSPLKSISPRAPTS